ncbi:MAG: hypothetical protein SOV49_09270 [Erysipelotrichaceae bacterium]|nr:hypothetical protein [Erysipelotrichaceae bacterium]
MFLRKELIDGNYVTSVVSASKLLKRNTDSLRCAYKNNLFASLPNDSFLDELSIELDNIQ